VPLAGLEPARCFHHLILSQARLPIPPQGHFCGISGADHSHGANRVNGGRKTHGGAAPARFRRLLAAPKIGAKARFSRRAAMNEEVLNTSLRKFLKLVGVTSQREIEKAVRAAIASGKLKGNEALAAQVVLTIDKAGLSHKINGTIELE
jgi:hypothetical protein